MCAHTHLYAYIYSGGGAWNKAVAGLELALYTRLILNLWQFAQLCLSSAGLTDLCRSAELQNQSSAAVVVVAAQINYDVTHSP